MSKLKQALKLHGIETPEPGILLGVGREAVYGLITDGASAVEIWRRLRAVAGEIGYWPIIVGGEPDLRLLEDAFDSSSPPGQTATDLVAEGNKVAVTAWLTERAAAVDSARSPAAGEWPAGDRANHQFSLPIDGDNASPLPQVYVALVPTVLGWQVPAFMRFGGWNACPRPQYHVAMLKYWRQKYGSEVVGIGGRTLELVISRPPNDRNAAMRLAREQFVYCPGIVNAVAGSLEERAAMLLNATVWTFHWG